MRKKAAKKSISRNPSRPAKKMAKRTVKKLVRRRRAKSAAFSDGSPRPPRGTLFGGSEDSGGHRLQKVLAAAGYGSRRQCEDLIVTGRVEVDRQTVTELGVKVDPLKQEIRVDGESLPRAKPVYVALFKPKGYLCTNADQQGRKRAIDLIPREFGRLFPVGRLDMHSEGLLLLTNDGKLSEKLTHPRFGVEKVYRVLVAGLVTHEDLDRLRGGVYIAEGLVKPDNVILKKTIKQSSVLDITLSEGKNREIRRMLAHLGHKVMQLIRISIGPIKIGKMAPGEWRKLTPEEVRRLYES